MKKCKDCWLFTKCELPKDKICSEWWDKNNNKKTAILIVTSFIVLIILLIIFIFLKW